MSTLSIYFRHKPQLNWHSASLFSAFSLITVTLEICNIVQSKVNREFANLGASLTSTNMMAMQHKLNQRVIPQYVGQENMI